ncbi:MAG: PQQ-binding-like beta-propeller repeat protein, partial [Acidobacteria bacterium]|nr:PQQ-binding-like beta-propeller repeat protein [Acidobacteriota bacterium]
MEERPRTTLRGPTHRMKRNHRWYLFAMLISAIFVANQLPTTAGPVKKSVPAWPGWRGGPEARGVSSETGIPDTWSTTQNVAWKTPIPGRGHSSPVIWDKRVFLTTGVEGEVIPNMQVAVLKDYKEDEAKHPDSVDGNRTYDLRVLCLDRDSGKILWEQTAFHGVPYDFRHRFNTYASPTPVTDGKAVYAYFGTEGLYAYDFTGRQLWKAEIGKFSAAGVGIGNSPVLYKDKILLQIDFGEGEKSFIAAYDTKTGKELWRTPRKIQLSWSTPVVVETGQRAELVAIGNERIIAYDPESGKELWSTIGLENNAVNTSLQGFGMVIAYTGYPGRKILAIKTGGSGDVTESNIAWKQDRFTAYIPSGILYGDLAYFITGRGIMTALDAKSGEVKYSNGRVPVPATFTASPIAYDNKILLLSEDGDGFVIQAGDTYKVLRTNSLGEPIFSTPAAAAGKLFIRSEKNLWCISGKK